ncbi:hypothetical protein ACF08N_01815 [Streptomyces sp. NPDC015127]|uniref:hypothetical protein n=1 Tax=Streptomyces sp. NPDC015127 TaxID=3364939 RepID=UPI003700B5FC
MRAWFGPPLWEMEPPDADMYFGKVLRSSQSGTRLGRSQALTTWFLFLELRHKVRDPPDGGRAIAVQIGLPVGRLGWYAQVTVRCAS